MYFNFSRKTCEGPNLKCALRPATCDLSQNTKCDLFPGKWSHFIDQLFATKKGRVSTFCDQSHNTKCDHLPGKRSQMSRKIEMRPFDKGTAASIVDFFYYIWRQKRQL